MPEVRIDVVVRLYKEGQYGSLRDSMRRIDPPFTAKVLEREILKRSGKRRIPFLLIEYRGERFFVRESDMESGNDQREVRPAPRGRLTTTC